MTWVAGVDGCRGGWIVVLLQRTGNTWAPHVTLCPTFADVLTLDPKPAAIAIDIPIGLLDKPQPGGRECDRQARKLLGRRASSIFTPPTRPMLKASRYEQVRTQGLSIQSFNILPKIREVDQLMTPQLQRIVHEAHPELAFMSLAGAPTQYNKKTQEGQEERLQALQHLLRFIPFPSEKRTKVRGVKEELFSPATFPRSQAALDDLLDAYVLAWTAHRIASGQANHVPVEPTLDEKRLRMEIWY
jgi:predicted RNase H-like nuclease